MPRAIAMRDRSITAKVTVRLMLFLTLMYLLNQFDRGNLAFAEESLSADLGLSNAAFGFGAGIFFIGYFIFEVPSNLILHKVGARRWLARIMVSWGIVTVLMTLVQNESMFYVLRFLLGAAEAGFFPGAVYYIALWLPRRERGKALALLSAAGPAAYLLAGPSSGLLLGLDGAAGLHGWQWLFLLEGAATVVVGIVCWFLLTDRPADANWLTSAEREELTARIENDRDAEEPRRHSLFQTLRQPRVLLLAGVYACMQITNAGLIFWLPSVTRRIGDLSTFQVTSLSVTPYAFQIIGLFLLGRSSDRHGRHQLHVLVGCVCIALGLGVGAVVDPVVGLIALCFAFFGYGTMSAFWALASSYLGTTAAGAGGLAFVNAVSALGGFVGPTLFGYLLDVTGSVTASLMALAGVGALSAVLVMFVRSPSSNPSRPAAPVAPLQEKE
ncbi:MFS transporter [Streptomyces sp. NPDC002790]|uniref:MFS transporter n=1 Tax=Streptomyces sp. NPDC002790 TaxID=3154431 RepID=UPI003334A4BC